MIFSIEEYTKLTTEEVVVMYRSCRVCKRSDTVPLYDPLCELPAGGTGFVCGCGARHWHNNWDELIRSKVALRVKSHLERLALLGSETH